MWKATAHRLAVAMAMAALACGMAYSQEAEEEQTEDDEEVEEIIVVAPRPGDRTRVDPEYEDPLRKRILKDLYEMRMLEEEYEWRKAGADRSKSRIKLGYDPRDDYRMRNEMDFDELPFEQTKPATLFRFEF